jgi:predicted nuclease of predicted toxin-antitoxin system
VRFLLDNDIDAAVAPMLRQRGHECWTAREAGLATAPDDALTVWATTLNAVLISTDRESGQRRMRNAVGHHLWLRCPDWDVSDILAAHLDEIVTRLGSRHDLTIRVAKDNLAGSSDWR